MPVVRMKDLCKRFGKIAALEHVNLDIQPGKIIGLLGSNGAGKSTLLRHIVGLYLPTEGECVTLGCPAAKLGPKELSRIGYVHQNGELLGWMRCDQHIRYIASYYDTWNKSLEAKFIEDFEIPLKTKVSSLSPGQAQRLAILLAIGFDPSLLILDEPAAALDPLARMQFLDFLLGLIQHQDRTIVISSHILSDVEKIIDHVIIMDKGRILRDCGFDELQEEFTRVRFSAPQKPFPDAWPFPEVLESQKDNAQAVLLLHKVSAEDLDKAAVAMQCRMERLPLPLDELYKLVMVGTDQRQSIQTLVTAGH